MHGADQTADQKPLTWVEARKKVACSRLSVFELETSQNERGENEGGLRLTPRPVGYSWLN